MNLPAIFTFAGWSAYLNVVFHILSSASLMIFFAVGGIFGPINDALSVFFALSLLPIAGALYLSLRLAQPALALTAALLGAAAMLTMATLQALLVVGRVRFEQTLPAVLTATGMIGLWMLVYGVLALRAGALPAGLAWTLILTGVGYGLVAIGFWAGGQEHPLAAIGFLVGLIGGVIWPIWIGRLFLSGAIPGG